MKHVVIAGSFFHVKAVHYKNQYKSTRVEAMLPKSHSGPDQFNSARVDICLFMEGKITGNMFDHSIQTDFVSVVSDPFKSVRFRKFAEWSDSESCQIGPIWEDI